MYVTVVTATQIFLWEILSEEFPTLDPLMIHVFYPQPLVSVTRQF